MRMMTGTLKGKKILLDQPCGLPDKSKVRLAVESMGPQVDPGMKVEVSEEELKLIRRSRARIAKITRKECKVEL